MNSVPRFDAPWGVHLKVVTPVVSVLVGFVGVTLLRAPMSDVVKALLLTIVCGFLLAAPLFRVVGYELTRGELAILRPGWRTRIPLAGLRAVEMDAGLMSSSLRLLGNGGFWSFTGLFWNRRLGRFRAFVSDPRLAVALRFQERCVVVSPDRPEAFAACVRDVVGAGQLTGASH